MIEIIVGIESKDTTQYLAGFKLFPFLWISLIIISDQSLGVTSPENI